MWNQENVILALFHLRHFCTNSFHIIKYLYSALNDLVTLETKHRSFSEWSLWGPPQPLPDMRWGSRVVFIRRSSHWSLKSINYHHTRVWEAIALGPNTTFFLCKTEGLQTLCHLSKGCCGSASPPSGHRVGLPITRKNELKTGRPFKSRETSNQN